jgi:hypothetical protein
VADSALGRLLSEQVDYYRARASAHFEDTLDLPGGQELEAALDAFAPTGDVLELARGPGVWTPQLLRHADSVTVEGAESSTIRRQLRDGSAHRAVNVPHTPQELQARLARLGWDSTVSFSPGPFFWGAGARA